VRARVRHEALMFSLVKTEVGDVRDLEIEGADGALRARHYRPPASGSSEKPPLLVFFHGGGWVTGDLDTHDEPCRMLCRHAQVQVLSVDYRLAIAENLASCNFTDPFDLVFAVDVLEHVDDRDRTLAGVAQVLAPGGGLGFLTHNRTIAAFLQVIWDEEYVHHTMPEGLHDFARFITPGELTDGLQRNGMVVQEMKGIARAEDGTGRRVLTDDLTVTYLGWALRTR